MRFCFWKVGEARNPGLSICEGRIGRNDCLFVENKQTKKKESCEVEYGVIVFSRDLFVSRTHTQHTREEEKDVLDLWILFSLSEKKKEKRETKEKEGKMHGIADRDNQRQKQQNSRAKKE